MQAVLINIPLDSGSQSVVPGPRVSMSPGYAMPVLGLTQGPVNQKHRRLLGTSSIRTILPRDFEKCWSFQSRPPQPGAAGALRLLLYIQCHWDTVQFCVV